MLLQTDEKVGKKRNVSKVSIWENKMNKDLAGMYYGIPVLITLL